MVLLWENPNPTNAFAEQTVAVDFTGLKFMLIEMKSSVTSVAFFSYISEIVLGNKGFITKIDSYNDGAAITAIQRQFTIAANGIAFTRAFNYIGNATVNDQMIPYRIFGIKA